MELLVKVILKLHVWAAIIFYLIGFYVLFFSSKGGRFHKMAGWTYMIFATLLTVSAVAFLFIREVGYKLGPDDFSILGVGKLYFPLYLTFSGIRRIKLRNPNAKPGIIDMIAAYSLILVTVLTGLYAIHIHHRPYISNNHVVNWEVNFWDSMVIVYSVCLGVYDIIRYKKFDSSDRKKWLNAHAIRLIASYVAFWYASAPYNYFTIWLYYLVFPINYEIGMHTLYHGSPLLLFAALYWLYKSKYGKKLNIAV